VVQQAVEHRGGERLIVGEGARRLRHDRLLVKVMLPRL
jgi:hypothetical protein